MTEKQTYMRRQIDIMGNLGLFYIIIIALFAVPLFASFVVVLIKGVVDFRYAIFVGGAMLLIIGLFYLVKFIYRFFTNLRQDGFAAKRQAGRKMGRGEPVEISVFNGLLTFSYGRGANTPSIPYQQLENKENGTLLLPHTTPAPLNPASDTIVRLKELSELRKEEIISEDEFQSLKAKLLKSSENSE